ncbi:hypothetical protein [Sediminibacillus albus]|uniref:Uncharacterized protein n=1 Tax=Sediminibacillus albus TaxID=407036 RepID=A0A1G8X6Q3_9BACI|nr:hypothetical protein [Sediminibacillus albus]SDJ86329.1 hypothetical protein SAMN05216243_1201 [Sediminibacillus albus]
MFSQQIAIKLEIAAKRALNIKKNNSMAGVISVDFIENKQGAFTVLCACLAPYYLNATDEERITLDDLIQRYSYLQDCSIESYYKGTDRAAEELKLLLDDLGVQSPD